MNNRPASSPIIQIPEPCPMAWNSLKGDDNTRYCDHCEKNVHNLARLEPTEITELLNSREHICVRATFKPNGTLVTARELRWRSLRRIASFVLAPVALLLFGGCNPNPPLKTTTGAAKRVDNVSNDYTSKSEASDARQDLSPENRISDE